jgi:chaperonin cofactor prefoldin
MKKTIKNTLKQIKVKIEIILSSLIALFSKHYKEVVKELKDRLETIKKETIDTIKEGVK